MNEIPITVHGNVVAEPIARPTRNESVFTTFRIASTPYKRLPDGRFADGETSFFNVIAFGALAANVAAALRKGQPVIVQGTLTQRQWSVDGKSGTTGEIEARHIGHDLTWGRAAFERVSRAAALGSDRVSDPEVQHASRLLDGAGEERPANVDADGVVHDVPVPAVSGRATDVEGEDHVDAESDEVDHRIDQGLGDPDTDDYESVQLSA